jgi:hypothetical protein
MHLRVILLILLVLLIGLSYSVAREYFANPVITPAATPATPATPAATPNPVAPVAKQYKDIGSIPSNITLTPKVTLSDTGYNATELHKRTALLRDIKKIVHNELIANRINKDNHPMEMCNDTNSSNCDSVQQGNEYRRSKEDMSKYIKKDAIPCWGCTLDY